MGRAAAVLRWLATEGGRSAIAGVGCTSLSSSILLKLHLPSHPPTHTRSLISRSFTLSAATASPPAPAPAFSSSRAVPVHALAALVWACSLERPSLSTARAGADAQYPSPAELRAASRGGGSPLLGGSSPLARYGGGGGGGASGLGSPSGFLPAGGGARSPATTFPRLAVQTQAGTPLGGAGEQSSPAQRPRGGSSEAAARTLARRAAAPAAAAAHLASHGAALTAALGGGGGALAAALRESPPAGGTLHLSGLRRATRAVGAPGPPGGPLPSILVEDCSDSTLLLSLASGRATLAGLTRCTVLLGPCAGLVTLEGCEGCVLLAAGAALTLHNARDCALQLWAASAPLLLGDCSGLRLAPYGARYEGLGAQAAAAGLLPGANRWDAPVDAALGGGGGGGAWAHLPPAEFSLRAALPAGGPPGGAPLEAAALALAGAPPRGGGAEAQEAAEWEGAAPPAAARCLPLPPAYAAELRRRAEADARVRAEVQETARALPPAAAARLQLAMQAAFKVREGGGGGAPSSPSIHAARLTHTHAPPTSPPTQEWLAENGRAHRVAELVRGSGGS